jgi:hypothetical protein
LFEVKEGEVMQIPREQVLEFVTTGDDTVAVAEEELPAYVDTDRDAVLLNELGIDSTALLGQFNGRRL